MWASLPTATCPIKKAGAAATAAVAETMVRTPTSIATTTERAARTAAARMIVPSMPSTASLSTAPSSTATATSSFHFPSLTRREQALSNHLLNNTRIVDYKKKNTNKNVESTTIYNNVPITTKGTAICTTLPAAAAAATPASQTTTGTQTIRTLQDFVKQIPSAVQERKRYDIEPGANDDPIANLFRYVRVNVYVCVCLCTVHAFSMCDIYVRWAVAHFDYLDGGRWEVMFFLSWCFLFLPPCLHDTHSIMPGIVLYLSCFFYFVTAP